LQSEIDKHRITLDINSQLQAIGFGLKQLRLLRDMIGEISEANEISHQQAVPEFIKNIEEQYDSKLGFEKIINEKKDQIDLVNKELNKNRQSLWFTPLIGPSLAVFFKKV
jgi:hypothetical protein